MGGLRMIIGMAVFLLAGCGQAGPHFRELEPVRIEVQGDVFDVRVRGRLAEAIRRNPRYAPRLGEVGPRAALAMEVVSGCPVKEIRGDAAMVLGILDCDGGKDGGKVPSRDRGQMGRGRLPPEDCAILDRWRQMGGQEEALVLDCTRI